MIRVLGLAGLALATWLVAATQVPTHVRLPVAAVVAGATVTQGFGCTTLELEPFDPNCPSRHFHTGIDLAAPEGNDVYSATDGTVTTGYEPLGAGNFVAVRVDSHVRIVYCHLSAFRVTAGQTVSAGQLIGLVGSTGLATGPHVHLQVDVDGFPVDPATFLAS
ncbi:MAG TPA: M23 family metallopeptidase [Candidatus Dormibacteraeota bacterium]|nr:M23 family metallopeptidase [Candidatus Dormibacteraeota bacterium]